ncbi:MAG: hypothetical protein ACRBDL_07720 [Alphaproteobacteria bacterium]
MDRDALCAKLEQNADIPTFDQQDIMNMIDGTGMDGASLSSDPSATPILDQCNITLTEMGESAPETMQYTPPTQGLDL